jgi:hypothetical protein
VQVNDDGSRPSIEIRLNVSITDVRNNTVTRASFESSGCGAYANHIMWDEIPERVRAAIAKTCDEGLQHITRYCRVMQLTEEAEEES